MKSFGYISSAAALLVMAACADTQGPEFVGRQPGALVVTGWTGGVPLSSGTGGLVDWSGNRQPNDIAPAEVISSPDTVTAGSAFAVTTWTVGVSGCWRADGQSVTVQTRRVVLKPFDGHSGAEACTEALRFLPHASTLVLNEPGVWTLRVEGRRLRLGDDVWEEPVAAEKTIVVR